jgi:hypothetical protein
MWHEDAVPLAQRIEPHAVEWPVVGEAPLLVWCRKHGPLRLPVVLVAEWAKQAAASSKQRLSFLAPA